jgi:hypothetical protein
MAIASFGPTASVEMSVTTTSSNVVIPTTGTPTIALVSNLSGQPVFVAMGTSSTVTVTVGGGVPVMPGTQLALTISPNTYLAAITEAAAAGINITVGN